MKYLVNRDTKEHRIADSETVRTLAVHALASGGPEPDLFLFAGGVWDVVEADAEGWIKWEGGECPLPDNVKCQLWLKHSDKASFISEASSWSWGAPDFTKYRPILDKPESVVKESLTTEKRHVKADGYVPPLQYDPRSVSFNVLKRLEAAHEAAQSIPDLEAELRDVLGRMGYDLVARDPFVEPIYESDMVDGAEGFTNTEPDMTDWRNWRAGDLLECVNGCAGHYTAGNTYEILRIHHDHIKTRLDDKGSEDNGWYAENFRFHSRPEVTS